MITIETDEKALEPKGAPFIIDCFPFKHGEQMDYALVSLDEDKIYNWPMVYILANETTAYVGQTTSVASRMSQHGANEEKKDFTTVNVIFNEEFNSSVITDYEHKLIGHMHGDRRYCLTNKNDGMTDTNYFSKAQYAEMFKALWEELRVLGLADHTLDEIEESEVFKYSPFKSLTVDQRVALDSIYLSIRNGLDSAKPIVVEGMPGTGKTILAIYLLKMLKDDPVYKNLNIRIVEPVTSLRNTLRQAFKGVSGLSQDDIIAPADVAKSEYRCGKDFTKPFDIVLVDEAHRLKRRVNLGTQFGSFDKTNERLGLASGSTQMDWLISQSKLAVFFYDPLQAVGPSCLSPEGIQKSLGDSILSPIKLDTQMRVKGGKGYLDYISEILSSRNPQPADFENYEFVLHDDFKNFTDSFNQTFSTHSLSRMIAGYAWKRNTKGNDDPNAFDISFDGVSLRWNCTYDNWAGKGFNDNAIAHEVGCVRSIQGYDLSYAYVIIGDDLELDEATGELRANKNNYFDRNGKATATSEELTRYIKNIYYVLLTRGIYGTHVYVANKKLRNYLKRFFL